MTAVTGLKLYTLCTEYIIYCATHKEGSRRGVRLVAGGGGRVQLPQREVAVRVRRRELVAVVREAHARHLGERARRARRPHARAVPPLPQLHRPVRAARQVCRSNITFV